MHQRNLVRDDARIHQHVLAYSPKRPITPCGRGRSWKKIALEMARPALGERAEPKEGICGVLGTATALSSRTWKEGNLPCAGIIIKNGFEVRMTGFSAIYAGHVCKL